MKIVSFLFVLVFLFVSCEKAEKGADVNTPLIVTNEVTDIANTTAVCGGNITSDGGSEITSRGVCWKLSKNPTISDSKSICESADIGEFECLMEGLTANTTYYVRAYATNINGTSYGNEISFKTSLVAEIIEGTMTDQDGKTYKTIKYGTQTWMAENLKTTKYKDGTSIPNITDKTSWKNLTSGAYCYFDNIEGNKEFLYNWYTVNSGKLCPNGWHVPSGEEWSILQSFLTKNGYGYSGNGTNGDNGKSLAYTSGWANDSEAGNIGNDQSSNNRSGFSAIPCGFRSGGDGIFYYKDMYCRWWSSSSRGTNTGYSVSLSYNHHLLSWGDDNVKSGFSVRLVKD